MGKRNEESPTKFHIEIRVPIEGGINYWCGKAKQTGDNVVLENDIDKDIWYADELGNFRYELVDADSGRPFKVGEKVSGMIGDRTIKGAYRHLTRDTLRDGIQMYEELRMKGEIGGASIHDDSAFDAECADSIIQLAVFGTLVFG